MPNNHLLHNKGLSQLVLSREKPVKQVIHLRLIQYFIVSLFLLFIYLRLKAISGWMGRLDIHTLLELTATLFSFFVGSFSLIKFYTRRNNKYLFIGFGFIYAALVNVYHTYITYSSFAPIEDNLLSHASGFVLSSFAFASVVFWFLESRFKSLRKKEAYLTSIILAYFTIFFVLLVPARFLNIIVALFFALAFFGYLYKKYWHFKYFEHWFILSLLVGFMVQIMYLSSVSPLDAMYIGAHILKVVVYTFSLIGLLVSMNIAFLEIEKGKDTMEAIVQSIGNPVFVTDASEKVILMNSKAENFSEIDFSQAEGRPYSDIFCFAFENNLKKAYPLFIKQAIEKQDIKETINHTVLFVPSGVAKPVSATAAPILDKEKRIIGCIVVMRDMSKQRELERIKDNFLSVAAHQLRTPLGAVRWNLEMILNGEHGILPAPAKKIVSELHEITMRFINIVNDLLSVSRIDQLRVFDQPTETDIIILTDEAVAELKAEMARKQVSLLVDVKKEAIPKMNVDPTRFKEVIINLLSNAIRYNKKGGSVTLKIFTHNKHLHFVVSDTGIGIPKSEQELIFTKFFRARNAVAEVVDGSGLGLFVVKSYIEGWGGSVSFTSNEGKGTTFVVKIPLKVKKHKLGENMNSAFR